MKIKLVTTKKAVKTSLIILLILITGKVNAQFTGFKYGARFGIGSATFTNDANSDFKSKLLLQAGMTSNYQFNNNVGLMADVLLTSKGSKFNGSTTETLLGTERKYKFTDTYNFYYIEIPFMAKVSFGSPDFSFKLYGGPSYNFNLGSSETREYDDANYNDNNGYEAKEVNDLDVSETALVLGGGIDVVSNGKLLFLDVRYSRSTNYFRLFDNSEAFSSYVSINIGHMF